MSLHSTGRKNPFTVIHPEPKPDKTESFIQDQTHHSKPNDTADGGHDDHNTTPMTTSDPKPRFFGLQRWIIEILALVLSIASFIVIVIVLRIYNGHSVANLRLPTGLTLNAVVAALSTVSRASLLVAVSSALIQELWLFYAEEAKKTDCSSRLNHVDVFDSASRGTWGSLILLFSFHYRRIFASLAALVTIFSLLFGIFMQQVIVYDNYPLDSDSSLAPGNVPRTENWNKFIGVPTESTTGGGFGPPLDFVASFYDGVLKGGILPPLAHCLSGNCTWPLTPSLAICGGCAPSEPNKVVCYIDKPSDQYYCNYTLPSGSVAQLWNFDAESSGDADPSGNGAPGFQVLSSSTGSHFNVLKGNRAYIANFDVVGVPYDLLASVNITNDKLLTSECALWMCVQTYNTTTISGIQLQTVSSQMNDLNASGILPGGAASNVTFPPLPPTLDPSETTVFTVETFAITAMIAFSDRVISGTIWLNTAGNVFSSDLVQGIWYGTTDLNTWINNVATSLTGAIRSTEQRSRPEFNGIAYALSVHVRWYWILLPLVLVALSILILIAAIIRTARSPVEPWKGSPLTFLLFGVDDPVRIASYGHGINFNGFQNAVGEQKVQLVEQGGTLWKFKSC